jgi:hypothetical protein
MALNTSEEDKGSNDLQLVASKSFKSFYYNDARNPKVSFLDMIFDFKCVLVGKQYFKINNLLVLTFNQCHYHILNKMVIGSKHGKVDQKVRSPKSKF